MFIAKEIKPVEDPRHCVCGLCQSVDILSYRDSVLNREVCTVCGLYLIDAEKMWADSMSYNAIV